MTVTTGSDTHPVPSEHNPLASMPHDTHGGISNPVLGMLLFITSEVMFFGGLFAAYFNIRANAAQWPPINPETSEPFHLQVLPVVTTNGVTSYSFVLIATILLITSSFTCQYAIWKIRSDDRTRFIRAMAVTIILGIVFLLMQLTDYAILGNEGLIRIAVAREPSEALPLSGSFSGFPSDDLGMEVSVKVEREDSVEAEPSAALRA